MIEQLRAELSGHAAKLERKRKIEAMLRELADEERELAERERAWKAVLLKEEEDVDRLERTTATSILYSMLGKKEKKLDKEQQEAFAAKLKYDAAMRQLDDCKRRREAFEDENRTLSGCAGRYDEVFNTLQNLLREDPAYAGRLCALERRRGEADGQLRELDEALAAGSDAMRQIDYIEDSLGSAEGWGTWDLFGGGLISDLAKHSHLDSAQAGAEHLQVLLSRFKSELADVYVDAQLGAVNIDGFLRFADYFFDGLIADWSVLSRIHDSQDCVYRVRQQVGDALWRLQTLRAARAAEKDAVEKQIEELVAQA